MLMSSLGLFETLKVDECIQSVQTREKREDCCSLDVALRALALWRFWLATSFFFCFFLFILIHDVSR